jgi:hypothetical protein
MAFWLAVLGGAVFVRVAINIGFYETCVMLFNVVISSYLALLLTPIITDVIPAAGAMPYGHVLTLLATAVAILLILYAVSYTFLTSQATVSFPKIVENLVAGLLGFLTGFLAFSFLVFLICLTPTREHPFVSKLGLDPESQQANVSYICWWCDLVNMVAASHDHRLSGREAVNQLLESVQPTAPPTSHTPAETGQPRGG